MSPFKALAAAVLLSSVASVCSAQTPAEAVPAEKQITNRLQQMYDAEKHHDLLFVLARLSDDFSEVAGDGAIYHRGDIEKGWPDVKLNNYKLSDCLFKLMSRDAAYLACKMEVDAVYKGRPIPNQMRVTTVWTRQKAAWVLRFKQATLIPPAQKTDVGLSPKGTGCAAQ